MEQIVGKQSIQFQQAAHILSGAAIVGKKEGDGPLGKYFDKIGEEDGLFGCTSWEEAESNLQKEAVSMAIEKAGIEKWQLRMIYAGDLLAQTIASSFGIMGFDTPIYGLYGACSTMGEALSLSAMAVSGGFWQCGKRISISFRIRKSETFISYMDSDRQRRMYFGNERRKSQNCRNYNRKNCGLRL